MSQLPTPMERAEDESIRAITNVTLKFRKDALKNTKNSKKDSESRPPSPPRNTRSAGGGAGGIYSGRYKGIVKTKKGQEMQQQQAAEKHHQTAYSHRATYHVDSAFPPEGKGRSSTASAAMRPTQPRPSSGAPTRGITSAPSAEMSGSHHPAHSGSPTRHDRHSITPQKHESGLSANSTSGVVVRERRSGGDHTGKPDYQWGVQHDISGHLAHELACRVRPSSSAMAVVTDHCSRPPPPQWHQHQQHHHQHQHQLQLPPQNNQDDHQHRLLPPGWNFFTASPSATDALPTHPAVASKSAKRSMRSKEDSSSFSHFSLQDALEYLESNPQHSFLHVVSRVHLPLAMRRSQEDRECCFYDLLVLGVPGTDKSGSLKSEAGKFHEELLQSNHLMQLSLQGLLSTDPASQGGDFMSLAEFLREKEKVSQLRTKRIFRQFLVKKAMLIWKGHVSSKVFRANREATQSKTIFSTPLILQALQRVRNATYSLETSVDLFAFHKPGAMNLAEFLQLQKEKIHRISVKLRNMVNNLGTYLQTVFVKLTSFENVNLHIQEQARSHPYSSTIQELKVKFDGLVAARVKGVAGPDSEWDSVRGVVRFFTEQQTNMEKVLRMGQFMVENSLLKIMFHFWTRLSQTVHGLRPVTVQCMDGEDVAVWGSLQDRDAKFEARVRRSSIGDAIASAPATDRCPQRPKTTSSDDPFSIDMAILTYERNPFLDPTGALTYVTPNLDVEPALSPRPVAVTLESMFGDPMRAAAAGVSLAASRKGGRGADGKLDDNDDVNAGDEVTSAPKRIVVVPPPAPPEKILSSGALTGQCDNFFVSKSWVQQGSYLSVDTALVFSADPNTKVPTTKHSTWSLNDVKIRGCPHRLEMITDLHMLYNALGQLLEETPNLVKQKFILRRNSSSMPDDGKKDKTKNLLTDDELHAISTSSDVGVGAIKLNNTRYFNNLKSSAILSSPDLFEISIRCMHQFRAAYNQSVDMDSVVLRLQDTFRKIWTISPEFLCRQLDRSAILPKIRELIDFDSTESLVDLEAVLERDSQKITGFKNTVALLNSSRSLKNQYADVKNSLGLITSFATVIAQIDDARVFKTTALFQKLPQTCITRMNSINLFNRKLKSYFQNEDPSMNNVIFLLLKLKNFDAAKDLLETEFDFCNDVYNVVVEHEKEVAEETLLQELREHPEHTRESWRALKNAPPAVKIAVINFGELLNKDAAEKAIKKISNKRKSIQPVTAHTSFQVYASERDSLFDVVSKCRMFLLYRLRTAGEEIKAQISALHLEISALLEMVTSCNVTLPSTNDNDNDNDNEGDADRDAAAQADKRSVQLAGEVHSALNKCKYRMTQVRERVDSNTKAQRLVVDSHMIVGAAESFLDVKFLDNFADMDSLEKFFALKYRSCSSILDASLTVKKLHHSKLVTIEVAQVYKKYQSIAENRKYLMEASSGDSSTACLSRLFDELTPMLEVVTFFKSKYMKIRHWDQLNKTVMSACGLQLVTNAGVGAENIALNEVYVDPESKESTIHSLGTLRSQQVKTFLDKGMVKQLSTLRNIAADACIEGMIEKTLEAVDHAMKTMKVAISLDWLEDKIFRNKIFFQLHRITNCVQLSVSIQYCLKALTICEHTAFDMAIEIFDDKFHFIRLTLQDMYQLIRSIDLVQKKWITVFHYVKFTTSGEIEREIERYFQSSTEEIKKIEVAVQSSTNATFYSIFQKVNSLGFAIDSVSSNLTHVMKDVHTMVQSMLDGYPRLSLLPYHRTKKLIRAWLVNPHEQMGVITRCITDIFPGVGKLTLIQDENSLLPIVQGVCSSDGAEALTFSNGVRMEVSLDEFLKAFENELRSVLATKCDLLISDHIEASREYFLDHSPNEIINTIENCFATRLDQTLNTPYDQRKYCKPNQCITLVNLALFAEHLWFCFGYAVGVVDICRPDFLSKGALFSSKWRTLVTKLNAVCKKNLRVIQQELQGGHCDEKTRKLYITLFQLEISFIQCLDEIISCPCLESAIEMWAGRYQVRFLYDKGERWRESPFEITLGCVGVSYGLEYQGAQVRAPIGHTLENALQKVIGSAFVAKGTVFVSQDSDNSPTESIGEYCVSCSDVADALGRIYTTLSSIKSERCVRFFLTRLCVLDAVGCIDFANLSHDSIQLLITGMTSIWSSINKKDDQNLANGLRYPIMSSRDSAITGPVQNGRQKNVMMNIRKNLAGQGKAYSGIFVVGLASESLNSDINLLDYFSKSAFNTITVNYSRPVEDLGLLLATRGFKYGYLLQLVMQEVIHLLYRKYNYQDSISYLSSSLLINTIVSQCSAILIRTRGDLSVINHTPTDQEVLRIEIECLYNVLLEQVVLLGQCSQEDLVEIHKDVRHIMQQQLNTVLDKSNRFTLSDSTFLSEVVVSYETKAVLNRAMKHLGLLPGSQFMQQCSTVWKSICCLQSMLIVSGPAGCGKSSLINCAVQALKQEGMTKLTEISNLMALEHWRAAKTLIKAATKWLSLRFGKGKRGGSTSRGGREGGKGNASKFPVKTTVIHYASLPTECLIGKFNEEGGWMDGMLLRKLRETDEDVEKDINNRTGVQSAQIIILEGPVGSNLEQIFTHSTYLTRGGSVDGDSACRLVFPTGEKTHLHGSVSIVLETSDLSHASPSLLMHTTHVHCGVAPSFASKRLLTVWLRSICNWLRPYPCWIEPLNDINKALLRTDFVKELLTCDMSASEMNAITAYSRMSTFISYLEELLLQCHQLIVTSIATSKTFEVDAFDLKAGDEGDDSDGSSLSADSASSSASEEANSDLTFDISLKEKEKLKVRVLLSLIYSAVWGFGGGVNGTDRRVFFDRLVKDAAEKYISRDVMKLQGNLLLFELTLDLPQCCFVQALNLSPQIEKKTIGTKPRSAFVDPWSLNGSRAAGSGDEDNSSVDLMPLEARLVLNDRSNRAALPDLVLHTPSSKAVKSAFELLVKSGSNVLFMGHVGAGKSRIIGESLQALGAHCPSPMTMKSEIMSKLVDIIGDEAVPEGIPSILELVRKLVYEATYFDNQHDDSIDDITMWQKIRKSVDDLMPELLRKHDIHKHFSNKTLYTAKTSLCSTSNASLVRDWLVRELRTESADILESPRETYAMVFIDDFHLIIPSSARADQAQHDDGAEGSRIVENKVENLVKGLVSRARPYRVVTDTRMPLDSAQQQRSAAAQSVRMDGRIYDHRVMPTSLDPAPILHQSFVTDPSQALKSCQNNFFVNQLGVISACSGDHKHLQSNSCFSQVLSYFSIIAAPQMTTEELHTAFQLGAVEAMLHGYVSAQKSEGLFMKSRYIHELVKGTLQVVDGVLGSSLLLNPLETALKEYITPNMQWIGKFCGTFSLATKHLTSTSSLLQLWTHEWKRFTVDPLPNGTLKSRLMWSFKKMLNEIDQESWGLDSGWLQSMIDGIEVTTGDIWVNASYLTSTAYRLEQDFGSFDEYDANDSVYRPVALHPDIPLKNHVDSGGATSLELGTSFSFNEVLDLPDLVGASDVRAVLYSEAFSYVLRLVRLLSTVGTNILLPSHVGSHVVQALKLASAICHMKFFVFDCKDKRDVSMQAPSPQTLHSNDFKTFLKQSLLAVGGFKVVKSQHFKNNQQTQVNRHVKYLCVPSEKIMMVVTSSQLMSDEDRRLLQYTVDLDNPCLIFNNREITGLIAAARINSETGAEIITKRRRQFKKDVLNAEKRRKRMEAGELLDHEDPALAAVEEGDEEDEDQDEISLSSVDSDCDTASYDYEDDDIYVSVTDSPSTHLQSEMMRNVHRPPSPSTHLDMSSPNYKQKKAEGSPGLGSSFSNATSVFGAGGAVKDQKGNNLDRTAADEFQTYVYQLIKARLVESVKLRLKTVLCLDTPRAREVFTASGNFQFQFHAKSKSGVKSSVLPTATSTTAGGPDSFSFSSGGLGDSRQQRVSRSSIVGGVRRPSRRFSLQSKSPLELQNVFLSHKKQTSGGVSGDASSNANPSVGGNYVGFMATDSTSPTTESFLVAQNIMMNCPILSSVLLRRFSCLFWHIDRDLAVGGICSAMMGVGKQRLLANTGLDLTPNAAAHVFCLPLQLCSVGEGGKYMYSSPDGDRAAPGSRHAGGKDSTDKAEPSMRGSTCTIQLRTTVKNHLPKTSNLGRVGVWGGFIGETLLASEQATIADESNPRRSVSAMRKSYIRQRNTRVDKSVSAKFNEDVARTLSSMTTEAETLLAQLLALPLPCDHIFLTQPVLLIDSERGAEIACTVVRFILESGGQSLLRRKLHLITALTLEDEAVQFLKNLDSNTVKLEKLINEILAAIRETNAEMSAQWTLIERAQAEALNMEDFQTLYEGLAMAQEDVASTVQESEYRQAHINDLLKNELDVVRSIKPAAWMSFGQQFQGEVQDRNILVMHALLGLAGKIPLGHDGALPVGKLRDDVIVKQSISMLKSLDFVDSVLSIDPAALSVAQIATVVEINAKLTEMVDFRKQAERHAQKKEKSLLKGGAVIQLPCTVVGVVAHDIIAELENDDTEVRDVEEENDEREVVQEVNPDGETSASGEDKGVSEEESIGFDYFEHTTFNILVNFLHKLGEIIALVTTKGYCDRKISMRESLVTKSTRQLNTALNAHIRELKQGYKEFESQHHLYDAELARCRAKLTKLAPLEDSRDDYINALSQNMLYVEDELTHIDTILKYLVADSCIAVALMVRTGWLPEQLRQESHDAMKQFIGSLDVDHSDSPYLLGCMMDRLQVRLWTQYTKGLLPRDIQSINAMSLLFLSPAASFIIDPEGVAEKAIVGALIGDFECFVVSGGSFSMLELEKQLNVFASRLSDDTHLGFAVIITDVQAGATDDLVAFLSAEVDFVPPPDAANSPRERRRHGTDDMGVAFNPTYHTEFSPQNLMQLSKVRVIVLSTQPPTLDTHGVGAPFPPCCFKHMLVLHWITAVQGSFFVDSRQLNTAMNKDHCGSSLLENVIVEALCQKISPSHFTKLGVINNRIIDYYYELSAIENEAFNAVVDWAKSSPENQEDAIRTERDLYETSNHLSGSTPCKMGLLDCSQGTMSIIMQAVAKRGSATKQCVMTEVLERDSLLYSAALLEVSNMSASFFRMAGALLPTHALPPHALTAVVIGVKCTQDFINSKCTYRLLTRIPSTMADLRKHMDSLRSFQRMYSNRLKDRKIKSADTNNSNDSTQREETHLLSRRKTSIRGLSVSTSRDVSYLIRSSSFGMGDSSDQGPALAGPVSPAPGRIMREACFSRKISKAPTPASQRMVNVVKSLRMTEFVSIPVWRREGLMADMSVLTQPLHSLFLNASVSYLLDNVKPGLEWLVKFCLVMCTWAASVPLPPEEVRTLVTFISHQTCGAPTYFQVSYPYANRPAAVVVMEPEEYADDDDEREKGDSNATHETRHNKVNAKRHHGVINKAPKPGQRVSVLAKHTKMRPDMFTRFTRGVRKNMLVSARVAAVLAKTSARHAELGRPVRSTTTAKIAMTKRGVTQFEPSEYQTKLRTLSRLEQKLATMTAWNGKGIGPLDGLWVSRRSLRYKIDYLTVVQTFRTTSGPKRRWDPVFSEGREQSAQLVMKNLLFKPVVRMEDDFMAEYMRIMGMRVTNETGSGAMVIHSDRDGGRASVDITSALTEETPPSTIASSSRAAGSINPSVARKTCRVSLIMTANNVGRLSKHSSGTAGGGGGSVRTPRPPKQPAPPSAPSASSLSVLRGRAMRDRTLRRQSVDIRGISKATIGAVKEVNSSDAGTGVGNKPQPFGFLNRKQSMSTRALIDEKKHLSGLLKSSISVQQFKLLEKHSALAPVFRGIEEGILNYHEEFETWKNFMEGLVSIDFKNLSDVELVTLAAKVVPPQLNPDDLSDKDKGSVGCWALGKELTILQTLILTSVLVPQAVEGAFEILFTLLSAYINRGNVLVKHKDEFLLDNDDSDHDEDDADDVEDWVELSSSEDEEEDQEEGVEEEDEGGKVVLAHGDDRGVISVASMVRHSSKIKPKGGGEVTEKAGGDSEDIDEEGERRDMEDKEDTEDVEGGEADDVVTDLFLSSNSLAGATLSRAESISRANSIGGASVICRTNSMNSEHEMDESEDDSEHEMDETEDDIFDDDKDRFQENTFLFNSWTHLKRIVANTEQGIRIRLSRNRSPHRLCCRDFENWEEVLLSCLKQPSDTTKFQLITQLRSTFDGKAPLYLSSNNSRKNTASLTNRAREYANQHSVSNSQMTVLNCHFETLDLESNLYRLNMSYEGRLNAMACMKKFTEQLSSSITKRSDNSNDICLRATSVEMLDFHNNLGNSILCSSLTSNFSFELTEIAVNVPSKRFDSGGPSAPLKDFADMHSVLTPSTAMSSQLRSKRMLFKKPSYNFTSLLPGYSRGSSNVLMSAEWSSRPDEHHPQSRRHFGTGPALTVGMLNFHWLSEHSMADLIGCAKMSSLSPGSVLMASRDLSFGAVGDEVDGQLHWVMNALRRVTSTRMIKSVRERIRYSSKVDMRTLSCVLVLWKFVLALESKLREMNNQPAQWSSVLVPLSLWQLARLCLKVSDIIFDASWQQTAVAYSESSFATPGSKEHLDKFCKKLLKDKSYVKAICLLAESFTKISFSDNEDTVEQDPNSDDEDDHDDSGGRSRPAPPPLPPSAQSSPGRSRLSMLVRMDALNMNKSTSNLNKGFLATYKDVHDKKITSEKEFMLGERLAEFAAKNATGDKLAIAAASKQAGSSEKPSEQRRRIREEKKAELIAAANSNYMSFDSLSSVNLYTLGPDPRLFIQQDMKDRLFGTLSVFFAGIIYSNAMLRHRETSSCSGLPSGGGAPARTSSSDAYHPIDMSKASSSKEASNKKYGDGRVTAACAEDETVMWPKVSPKHSDITIGSLMPHEVITTLVSWTFEGKDINSAAKKKMSTSVISKLKRGIGLVSALHKKRSVADAANAAAVSSEEERFRSWQSLNRLKEKYAKNADTSSQSTK